MMRTWILLLLVAGLLLAACQTRPGGAAALLPDVPNTTIVEGETITQFLSKLSDGAALTAGHPELIPVIQRVESTASCYQNTGAVALRTYTDKTLPLYAGIVAVVDRNAVADPANFFNCVIRSNGAQAAQAGLQPCAKTYTLKKSDNEFYIAYIATTPQLCEAFCSRLEGCAGQ